MMRGKGLGLKLTLGDSLTNFEDSMKDLEATYRVEGLSMNEEQLRVDGLAQEMEVTYAELIIGRRIGQGACSAVHLAEHETSGKVYAVKMFNTFDKGQRAQMISEVKLLYSIECECIVSIKGAWYHDGSIGLILEYMDWGSLEFLSAPHIKINEQALGAIVYQILWGLGYLHFDNRMHRDIKPGNVLINSNGDVKLSDFGISTLMDTTKQFKSSSVGTFRYMSPERLLGEDYNKSGDIWSVGIMVTQLWSKIYPFHYGAATPIELLTELESIDIDGYLESLRFPSLFREFIMCMLAIEPKKRLSTDELLRHPWLKQNGVTGLKKSQEIVKSWISGLPAHGSESSVKASKVESASANEDGVDTEENNSGIADRDIARPTSVSSSRMEAQRKHHSTIDDLLSDSHDEDHPLMATPTLSRSNSNSTNNSSNSINTDMSLNNSRNNSRNSSYNNLVPVRTGTSPSFGVAVLAAGGGGGEDRLKNMLPSTRPVFARSVSGSSNNSSNEIVDALEGNLGNMSVGESPASTQDSSITNDLDDIKKRARVYDSTTSTIGSSLGTGETDITHSKTQSTANFTTGTVESGMGEIAELDFDENEENMYLKEGFEKHDHEDHYDEDYDADGKKDGANKDARDFKDATYWENK